MKIHSELPEAVGEVAPGWHTNLPAFYERESKIAMPSLDVIDDKPNFYVLPLIRIADADYRQINGIPDDDELSHLTLVRKGGANLGALLFRSAKNGIIPPSMTHVDVEEAADLPLDDEGAIYSTTVGPGTEWYEGDFLMPTPRRSMPRKGFMMAMGAGFKAQTRGQTPTTFPNNTMVRSGPTAVHRMPSIDLAENPDRTIFLNFVAPIEEDL